MVGFYGGAPLEYAGIAQQGSDFVPSATGEVLGASLGEGLAENLTPRLFRSAGRFAAETGVIGVDDFGRPITTEPEPTIDPETANAEFGIKGHLSFDKPVPRSVAQDLSEHKRAQIEREDTIARRESGLLTGGAARFGASLVAGVLDPINLAVGFIPVVGEAREAALIAQAGSAAARAGVRAGLGGAQGAAAMTALQPLEFALSRQEREDYTMSMALRNIALGGVLGGGLHTGIGAALDRATGRYRNPLTQRLEEAGPEARETLLQGALAQNIEGRPVDVAPALDVLDAGRAAAEQPSVAAQQTAFTTAKGSTYDVHEDGTTTRNKSFHPEHGEADQGLQPRSEATFYVGPRDAIALGEIQSNGPNRIIAPLGDGRWGVKYLDGKDAGKFEGRTVVAPVSGSPAVGLTPVEIFAGGKRVHFGNEITEVRQAQSRRPAEAVAELTAAVRRDVDADSPVPREAAEVAARSTEDMDIIRAQITDLETRLAPEQDTAKPATERPAHPEIAAADVATELAEARARASEHAAVCIGRG